MSLYARAVFYPTLLYNVAMEKLGVREWYNRIDSTVLLGALPFRGMTEQLVREENVKGVVTMNEEFETRVFSNTIEEWERAGVVQLRLNTVDMVAPTLNKVKEGVNFIEIYNKEGASVYVHCKAGRTRSATVVACYLMKTYCLKPDEAVKHIQSRRPHIVLGGSQWDVLNKFYTEEVHSNLHKSDL